MIAVDQRAGYEYRPAWEKGSEYRGLISVEGYTVPGLHSVGSVEIHDGKVTSVSYANGLWIWSDNPYVEALCAPDEYEEVTKARQVDKTVSSIDIRRQSERNEEAYRSFPRWQPYFEWTRAHPPKLLSPSHEEYIEGLLGGSTNE